MKTLLTSALLVTFFLLTVGCASPRKERDCRYQEAFRQQLSESLLVRKYGYTIKDVRFSQDRRNALVTFTHPDWKPKDEPTAIDSKVKPDIEIILEADAFGRYLGTAHQPFYTPGTANTPGHPLVVDLYKK